MKIKYLVISIIFIVLVIPIVYILKSNYRLERIKNYLGFYSLYDQRKSNLVHTKNLETIRKKILLKDNTLLADSNPLYKVMIINYISKSKQKKILKEINKILKIKNNNFKKNDNLKTSYQLVSYRVSKKEAEQLNYLAARTSLITKRNKKGKDIYYPVLTIELSGYGRNYPKNDFLTPFIGYTKKILSDNRLTKHIGISGIEGYYEDTLNEKNIILSIDYNTQISLEKEMDEIKKKNKLNEVSCILLNLDNGTIESLASSNRFNPNSINRSDLSNLTPSVIQYLFDAKGVLNLIIAVIDEKLKKSNDMSLTYLNTLSDFGLLSKSNIDVLHERSFKIKKNFKVEINFMQLTKALSVFFNDGVLKEFKLSKKLLNNRDNDIKVIEKYILDKIDITKFFKILNKEKIILDFADLKKEAKVDFKYIEINEKRYFKAYFYIY